MTSQAFINVILPFPSGCSGAVNKVLQGLADLNRGNRPNQVAEQCLRDIGLVHFLSITVVDPVCPAEQYGQPNAPPAATPAAKAEDAHLMIEISADSGADEALEAIATGLRSELTQVLTAAKIGPDATDQLGTYLQQHQVPIGDSWRFGVWARSRALGQIFAGSPGLTVKRILGEAELAKRIGTLIEQHRNAAAWYRKSPRQVLDEIRDELWKTDDVKWAFVPEPMPVSLVPNEKFSYVSWPGLKAGWSILFKMFWPLLLLLGLLEGYEFVRLGWLIPERHWALYLPIALCGVFAVVLATLAIVAGLGYLGLRHLEETDPAVDRTPNVQQVADLMKVENFCAQNHLASVSRLKPGWLRRLTLRFAFIVVGTGNIVGVPGFLGKNGVIHFGRWMRLPGTDQLLFSSNYDGTWESYVADFIADAPTGVTAIWSNCVDFPRSNGLFGGGAATQRDRLVRWARRQQHPTRFWYSAYPDLTAERIRVNAAIRQGLASAESDADVRDWFSLFGSKPRPADELQVTQIPTLVFGSLLRLPHASCHAIAFNGDPRSCKNWLAACAEHASYGEALPGQTRALVVALTASGLDKLGLDPDALATFPVAFQQGMWPESRARELGDTDNNAPAHWEWGHGSLAPDALVLLYGFTQNDLADAEGSLRVSTQQHLGHDFLYSLTLKQRPPGPYPREPFGFTDGVSQPVLRGTVRARAQSASNDLVGAGEIVLGYPDNTGAIPPSPSIAVQHDPNHFLPDVGPDPFRKRPEFSTYEGTGRRDLGANGTFLVVRQLQQHVKALSGWLDKAVDRIGKDAIASANGRVTLLSGIGDPEGVPLARPRSSALAAPDLTPGSRDRREIQNAIAAKLVGRWQDGTSLVRNPRGPGSTQDPSAGPDNDFLLGAEDPGGQSCPFGAHIRRANPRDTRFPGSEAEIASTNRHRILRVGRPYQKPRSNGSNQAGSDDSEQGLLFMCLNADIERQFEFIQKTWLLNPNLHGLPGEVDPIMGRGPNKRLTVPTPTGAVVLEDIPDLVTLKGGGYFFVPGRSVLHYLTT